MPAVVEGRVTDSIEEGPGAFRLWIEAPAIARQGRPGQFVNVRAGDGIAPLLRRPFSFCDLSPEDGRFSLLIQVVGRGTAWLSTRRVGDPISVVGPLGNGFDTRSPLPETILCAGGIGVAPFPSLAAVLSGRTRLRAIVGARTAALCLCQHDFKRWDVPLQLSTEDGSAGVRGFVTGPLREALQSQSAGETTVYACGPEPMLAAVAALCLEYRCAAQLSVEAVMGCGVGACLSCVLRTPDGRYIRSCVEGPVFGAGDLLF